MKRKDLLELAASDEARQREIVRRLRNGLPLAGMIAAAALGGGCDEPMWGRTAGDVPRDGRAVVPEPQVVRKADTPPAEPASLNQDNEECDPPTAGDVPPPPPENRENEKKSARLLGAPLPPNRKNESRKPFVVGRRPAEKR